MSDDNFERDPRRIHEISMRPFEDQVYIKVFGEDIVISRRDKDDHNELDRIHAIDVTIGLPSGLILNGQEKALRENYWSLTVEFEQDWQTGEHGDWFKLGAQFYFTGYSHPPHLEFDRYVIVDWPALVLAHHRHPLPWHIKKNHGRQLASFKYINFVDIPQHCIIARFGWERDKELF